jgi:hypothetical protein
LIDLSVEYLKECFDYDEQSGILFWSKQRPVTHFLTTQTYQRWMTIYSGKEAGTTNTIKGIKYKSCCIGDTKYLIHRIVWAICVGKHPERVIDHIDGDSLNNRIDNLRDVSQTINSRNSKMRSNNTSGVNGVRWDKQRNKWVVYVTSHIDGISKTKNLGRFNNFDDALKCRESWEEELGGFTDRHGVKDDLLS